MLAIDDVRSTLMIRMYRTSLGTALLGDSLVTMQALPPNSIQLAITSPPFPLTFRKRKPYSLEVEGLANWLGKKQPDAARLKKARSGIAQMLLGQLAEEHFEALSTDVLGAQGFRV